MGPGVHGKAAGTAGLGTHNGAKLGWGLLLSVCAPTFEIQIFSGFQFEYLVMGL